MSKLKIGDLVFHRQRKSYFFYPQTIGIIVRKHIAMSNYICWEVWGSDWEPNNGYEYLAVGENDLEKVN